MHSEEERTASHWLKETQKGFIRIAVLILLSKKPQHGYELMKEIKYRTMGFWKPTPGGIYPILKSLEKSGYIQGEWTFQKNRKRKTYRITETGKTVLERAIAKESQIANSMKGLFAELIKEVLDVKVKSTPMPLFPHFFSAFLEDRKEKPRDVSQILEERRKQIESMIEELNKELESLNERLAHLEKHDHTHAKTSREE